MKVTVESIKKEYESAVANYKERAERITKLENDIAELQGKAKACAVEEDLTGFKQIKQEIEYQEYQLEALKMKQESEKEIKFPLEKVQAAWQDYETRRARTVSKLEEDLVATRQKLLNIMKEMSDTQNDGLKTRNTLAKYVGMKTPSNFADSETVQTLSITFPMKYFNLGYLDKGGNRIYEFDYLEDLKLIRIDLNQRMHRVTLFKQHIPAPVIVE